MPVLGKSRPASGFLAKPKVSGMRPVHSRYGNQTTSNGSDKGKRSKFRYGRFFFGFAAGIFLTVLQEVINVYYGGSGVAYSCVIVRFVEIFTGIIAMRDGKLNRSFI